MADDLVKHVEDAARAVARLDVRVSLSPLREAWDVRAACKAAITLAAIDGRHVREADLVGVMAGAPLPVPDSYLGAGTALAWWLRAMGRIHLSEPTARLVGRRVSQVRRAREHQAEWDGEDALSPAARRALGNAASRIGDLDADVWAEAGRRASLSSMASAGSGLVAIALGLKDALAADRDPGRHARSHDLRAIVERQAEERVEADIAGLGPEAAQAHRDAVQDMLASLDWEAPRGLGEAHMAVADRLVETGACSRRLGILTGATKRIAVERRGDDRAVGGFLRVLAKEAIEGEAILSALESTVAKWARMPGLSSDRRSSLPDVLWAFLVLPVVDADWIGTACGLEPRVVQKFVKRLADHGAIEPWSERMTEGIIGRAASVRLWVPAGFAASLARHQRVVSPASSPISFSRVMTRAEEAAARGIVPLPMADVFARFDRELVEIEEAFGHLWPKAPTGRRSLSAADA